MGEAFASAIGHDALQKIKSVESERWGAAAHCDHSAKHMHAHYLLLACKAAKEAATDDAVHELRALRAMFKCVWTHLENLGLDEDFEAAHRVFYQRFNVQ